MIRDKTIFAMQPRIAHSAFEASLVEHRILKGGMAAFVFRPKPKIPGNIGRV
jgi:hypothetical protein